MNRSTADHPPQGRRAPRHGTTAGVLVACAVLAAAACSPRAQTSTEIGEQAAESPATRVHDEVRFVGTEPGYAVRVTLGTVVVSGELHETWSIDGVERSEEDGHHVIEATGDGRSVRVVWREELCNDGMSDVYYPWTATVTIDSVPQPGCGALTSRWPTRSFVVDGRPVDFDAPCTREFEGLDIPSLADGRSSDAARDFAPTLAPIDLASASATFLLQIDHRGSSGLLSHTVLQRCDDGGYRVLFGPHDAENISPGDRRADAPFADLVVRSRDRGSATCDTPLTTTLSWQAGAYSPASVTCAPGGPVVWEEDCGPPPPSCP